jgi:hypothetical protein
MTTQAFTKQERLMGMGLPGRLLVTEIAESRSAIKQPETNIG